MNPAAMTLAAPKRPAEKRLPRATEILSMARPAPRSDWASPAPAVAKPQPAVRKKKTARKPPPWYKILIANAVLGLIVWGVYFMLCGDVKPPPTQSAAVQPSDDSKRPATKVPRAKDSGRPTEERRPLTEQGRRSDPVKPPESDHQEATPTPEVPTRLRVSGWDHPGFEPGPKRSPEQQKENTEPLKSPNRPDMDPVDKEPRLNDVKPVPSQPADGDDKLADKPADKPGDKPPQQVSFAGTWQTANGALFQITDDRTILTVELIGPGINIRAVYGKLSRTGGKPDAKHFNGTLDVTFLPDGIQRAIDTRVSVEDANHLKFTYLNWPTRVYSRKFGWRIEPKLRNEDWTRSPVAVK